MVEETDQDGLDDEIAQLEKKLQDAKKKSRRSLDGFPIKSPKAEVPLLHHDTHALLLLSDSALPLGSFAFSAGLESFLAHQRGKPLHASTITSFHRFLHLSLSSTASTVLPYVLAAHRQPDTLVSLTAALDASVLCPVVRRASTAQGKALLAIWERSLASAIGPSALSLPSPLDTLREMIRHPPAELPLQAHFAPLWGVVTHAMGLTTHQAAYVFLLNHAKAVLSAAVRASVMGPYQAQGVLVERSLQDDLRCAVQRNWSVPVEDATQVAPVLDLWMGRHELLYSRIFNS
ncbi:MAG: hypothetical protein M1838_003758 [Thelocarpon superellum]|nr:MAG: hypothetical protein M1838_003758 [Thelocarpon superellum]